MTSLESNSQMDQMGKWIKWGHPLKDLSNKNALHHQKK